MAIRTAFTSSQAVAAARKNSSSVVRIFVRLAFRAAFFMEDSIHEILTEIRAGTDVLAPDINLVQILEPEYVAVAQLGPTPADQLRAPRPSGKPGYGRGASRCSSVRKAASPHPSRPPPCGSV